MNTISLTRGMVALVSDEDFEWASAFNWCAQGTGRGRFYAARRVAGKISLLHREIANRMGLVGRTIDHINRNSLDNQRDNLRGTSYSENIVNSEKQRCGGSSRFKGVCRVSPRINQLNPWLAYVGTGKTRHYLGYHPTEEDAARSYNEGAKRFLPNTFLPNKV